MKFDQLGATQRRTRRSVVAMALLLVLFALVPQALFAQTLPSWVPAGVVQAVKSSYQGGQLPAGASFQRVQDVSLVPWFIGPPQYPKTWAVTVLIKKDAARNNRPLEKHLFHVNLQWDGVTYKVGYIFDRLYGYADNGAGVLSAIVTVKLVGSGNISPSLYAYAYDSSKNLTGRQQYYSLDNGKTWKLSQQDVFSFQTVNGVRLPTAMAYYGTNNVAIGAESFTYSCTSSACKLNNILYRTYNATTKVWTQQTRTVYTYTAGNPDYQKQINYLPKPQSVTRPEYDAGFDFKTFLQFLIP
jgi:hypothetical protein